MRLHNDKAMKSYSLKSRQNKSSSALKLSVRSQFPILIFPHGHGDACAPMRKSLHITLPEKNEGDTELIPRKYKYFSKQSIDYRVTVSSEFAPSASMRSGPGVTMLHSFQRWSGCKKCTSPALTCSAGRP